MINEIEGDLIALALKAEFDVIAHGCNCFCIMGSGIAKDMARVFKCNEYPKENPLLYKGDINKLGSIEYRDYIKTNETEIIHPRVTVVNAYTQYRPGKYLDLDALRLCLRKINHKFKDKLIGLPLIGCGIAGGIWDYTKEINDRSAKYTNMYMNHSAGRQDDVRTIIQKELRDCLVTIVHFKQFEI